MPQRPPDLDVNRRPVNVPAPIAPDGVVDDKEPGTWGGGFIKGLLGDKGLMTTAGVTAAGALAPLTGGASLATLLPLMAAGGAAGAVGSNLVRRATDSRPQESVGHDATVGALEGGLSAVGGPALSALGRGAGYVGRATTPYTRRMLSAGAGIGGFMSGNPASGMAGGVAMEALLNPKLAPLAMEAAGDAASMPTVRRTIGELGRKASSLFDEAPASMQSLREAHVKTRAAMNRSAGIRQSKADPRYSPSADDVDTFAETSQLADELAKRRALLDARGR